MPVEELRLQRAHIQQLGGLPGELADSLTALGGNGEVGGDVDALNVQQAAQWRQHHGQGSGRRAWAADLIRFFQAIEDLRVGFRHYLRRLIGRQGAGQVDQGAARSGGARGKTQGDRRAGGEEHQLDFAEIEFIDFPHPHVLATKRHRMPGRLAAGQQVQAAYREVLLFEDLHQGFANGAGGADHGNIKGLGHGGCLGHCGGSGTLPGGWG